MPSWLKLSLLVTYLAAVAVETWVTTAMASDPELQLRALATQEGIDIGSLTHEAYQAELDAGRSSLKATLAKLPEGSIPTPADLRMELAILSRPMCTRLKQEVPSLTPAQLRALMPGVVKSLLFRTRVKQRFASVLEGGELTATYSSIVQHVVKAMQEDPPMPPPAAPPGRQPAPAGDDQPAEDWSTSWARMRRSPGSILATWLGAAMFLALKWWSAAVPTLVVAIMCLAEWFVHSSTLAISAAVSGLAALAGLAVQWSLWLPGVLFTLAAAVGIGVLCYKPEDKSFWQAAFGGPAPQQPRPAPAARSEPAYVDTSQWESYPEAWGDDMFGDDTQREDAQAPALHQSLSQFAQGSSPTGPWSPTFAQQAGTGAAGPAGTWAVSPQAGQGSWSASNPFGLQPSTAAQPLGSNELAHMMTDSRWVGLGTGMRRAAPEIYWAIRQAGHANVREWWQSVWGSLPDTQQKSDLWHSATVCDLRLKELADKGPQALAIGLSSDDVPEGMLRQLAAAKEFKSTHDSEAANRILGFRAPGDSITPQWLQEDARSHSQAIYKQGLRLRGKGKGKGRGDGGADPPKGKAKAKGKAKGQPPE